MFTSWNRRRLLQSSAAAGAWLGLGGNLFSLPAVAADQAALDPKKVRLDAGIEPLVRLIEETPRQRLLEEVGGRIRAGLAYRDVLAALLLAGVKNIEPRPQVGFKFHAVLVVNSAHLASLASPAEHRWLPIFWALDHYKGAAEQDVRERGDWTMRPVDEAAAPPAHRARAALAQALDRWDEAAADAAVAVLARSGGLNDVYELLFRYGARDFRSIGHKAIYVANSFRTLQCIGRQHAEPVLRSLVYALLMHEGQNPAQHDLDADRPYRRNQELVGKIRPEWLSGKIDDQATEALVQTFRAGEPNEACDQVVELLNRGVAAQSVWDALQTAAAELVLCQPGIVALHAVTTTNALHFAFQNAAGEENRRLLLLQNAAFVCLFRRAMASRGEVKDLSVAELKPAKIGSDDRQTVEQIFAELTAQPLGAVQQTLAYLASDGDKPRRAQALIDAARVLVFVKGNDAHDYKFSSAILEDYYHLSPRWRDTYLAANVVMLTGSQAPDNRLVQRARRALSG